LEPQKVNTSRVVVQPDGGWQMGLKLLNHFPGHVEDGYDRGFTFLAFDVENAFRGIGIDPDLFLMKLLCDGGDDHLYPERAGIHAG